MTDTLLMVYQVVTCFHANFENNTSYDNNSSLLIRCEIYIYIYITFCELYSGNLVILIIH